MNGAGTQQEIYRWYLRGYLSGRNGGGDPGGADTMPIEHMAAKTLGLHHGMDDTAQKSRDGAAGPENIDTAINLVGSMIYGVDENGEVKND